MSINILDGVSGTREIREIAPIDRASPKMRSESDSMRGLGRFMFSSKVGSQLVTVLSRKALLHPSNKQIVLANEETRNVTSDEEHERYRGK